jgi:hypothetical protein
VVYVATSYWCDVSFRVINESRNQTAPRYSGDDLYGTNPSPAHESDVSTVVHWECE